MRTEEVLDYLIGMGLVCENFADLKGKGKTAEADMNVIRFFFFVRDKSKVYDALANTGYQALFYSLVANKEGRGRQKHAYFRSSGRVPKEQKTVSLRDY